MASDCQRANVSFFFKLTNAMHMWVIAPGEQQPAEEFSQPALLCAVDSLDETGRLCNDHARLFPTLFMLG